MEQPQNLILSQSDLSDQFLFSTSPTQNFVSGNFELTDGFDDLVPNGSFIFDNQNSNNNAIINNNLQNNNYFNNEIDASLNTDIFDENNNLNLEKLSNTVDIQDFFLNDDEIDVATLNPLKKEPKCLGEEEITLQEIKLLEIQQEVNSLNGTQDQEDDNSIDNKDSRKWERTLMNSSLVSNVKILNKTRCDKYSSTLPYLMYCSLKYAIQFEITLNNSVSDDVKCIVAQIEVLDIKTSLPVEDVDDPIVGKSEVALIKSSNNSNEKIYTGKMLLQFSSFLSYYKIKRFYKVKVSFMNPFNCKVPIATLISPVIKIYARKPYKKKGGKKVDEKEVDVTKKKNSEDVLVDGLLVGNIKSSKTIKNSKNLMQKRSLEIIVDENPKKRKKNEVVVNNGDMLLLKKTEKDTVNSLELFTKQLEGLMKINAKLTKEERKVAFQIMVEKLYNFNV